MEHESDDCTNCDWCFWHDNYRIIKRPGGLGRWRTRWGNPNDSITENGQNTEKSPGDLRWLAVTQTPVKNHQLTLMWKTPKDKYHDLARKLKKLWNMKVTIVPIVIGAFGTITTGLLKRLEDLEVGGRVETMQTTALLRTARILGRVLETWGNLVSLKLQWKTISWYWCEKL